MGNTEVTG